MVMANNFRVMKNPTSPLAENECSCQLPTNTIPAFVLVN